MSFKIGNLGSISIHGPPPRNGIPFAASSPAEEKKERGLICVEKADVNHPETGRKPEAVEKHVIRLIMIYPLHPTRNGCCGRPK